MRFLYQVFIQLFNSAVPVYALFNKKAKLFLDGRKNIFSELRDKLSSSLEPSSKVVWFHCSSLGEFEQARPFIERVRKLSADYKILITFFSPSGYEIRKNYIGADFVFYLPVDTRSNVKIFLDIVNPSYVFFVKYEFWYNFLSELSVRKIPTNLISANFRNDQFKGIYGMYLKKVLPFFNNLFVQNELSGKVLFEQDLLHVVVSGDLRYDQVSQTVLSVKKNQIVEMFKGESKLFIVGSSWSVDEEFISNSMLSLSSNYKLIIAPHEINEEHIQKVVSLFPNSIRFSSLVKDSVSVALEKLKKSNVLIIDNVGMLSSLYKYATIAYIGGGFGGGIHNILEAVAFGVPVIFGPNNHKFPEAQELVNSGGAFLMSTKDDFQKIMNHIHSNENSIPSASSICKQFVMDRVGATDKISRKVFSNLS